MEYLKLTEFYEKLESTQKRLEKTSLIAKLLMSASAEDLEYVVFLARGIIFPPWDERKIGVSSQLIMKALSLAVGASKEQIVELWKKKGDLGEIAAHLVKEKRQTTLTSKRLTIKKVLDNIRDLSKLEGSGTVDRKVSLMSELLTSASPIEAKYIVRTILEQLRIGVAEGTMRDALVWAYLEKESGMHYIKGELSVENREKYNACIDAVQNAYDLCNDLGLVAEALKKNGLNGLKHFSVRVGTPINSMLAIKTDTIEEAFEALGKPAQFEFKYDGFRVSVHKDGNNITLFTRRLENVTKQFPDIVEAVKKHVKGKSFILDTEAVGYDYKTKKYLPFQNVSQRIKRKYSIERLVKEIPIEVNVFDIMYYKGKSLINEPLSARTKILDKIIREKPLEIVLSKRLVTDDKKKIDKFYKESLKKAHEGLMIKNIKSNYNPGRYVGGWMKLKPILDSLDLVIIGAEYGTGRRAGSFSSFILGCKSGDQFLSCGMMGTGIKEIKGKGVTFKELTALLKPYMIKAAGRIVRIKPKIVIEITYGEIQKSPTYESGFALRFPRFKTIREDKSPQEANSLEDIKKIFDKQHGKE